MAMAAARLLSRRVCRSVLPSFSNSGISLASSPVVSPTDETLVSSRYLSISPVANKGFQCGKEDVRLRSLTQLVPFGRVFSTDATEGFSSEKIDDLSQTIVEAPKAPTVAPPRPFKLNNEQRKLAEVIGYKVVDRYTEDSFGKNKKPKAFAVVQVGSHQFKVSPNDLIYTEKLKYCDINDKLMLNKVLLLGSKDQTIVGRPTVPDAAVFAVVEEHALDEKVIIFKKKRRKNYRRTTGHRQELTRLRILEVKGINLDEPFPSVSQKLKATPSKKVNHTSADTNLGGIPTPALA